MSFRIKKSYPIGIALFLVGGGFLYWQTVHAVTRTWDGGGTDGTCGGGVGDGNKWSCAANWSGDTAPTSSDIALFDGTSTKNATINANINVAGIDINTGYTGTITQSGSYTVTVGASGWDQADGAFAGGSGAISIQTSTISSFTLSSGTFTSTSGAFTILKTSSTNSAFVHTAGGTFNHNNGTVVFTNGISPANATIDVATTETFYDVTANMLGGYALIVSSGDTLVVLGTLTHTDGNIATGTIEARGNVSVGSGADGGDGTLSFLVAGDQTITGNGGRTCNLNVAKSSGTLSAGTTNLAVTGFTLSSGTFTSTSGTFMLNPSAVGTHYFTHTAGGTFNHNGGTVTFYNGGNASITIDVATTETFNNLTVSMNSGYSFTITSGDTLVVLGAFTHTDGVIGTGTIEARGNVTVASTADGGSALLVFAGGNDQAYTDSGGDEMNGDITINKSGGAVALLSNADWNAANQDLVITSGVLRAGGNAALSTGSLTVNSGSLLKMTGGGDLTLGGNVSNGGAIVVESNQTCGGADDIQILSSVSGTQRSWSGTGSFTVYDATVKDQGGSAAITAYSSTSVSGNGGNWTFSGAACPAIPPAAALGTGVFQLGTGVINLR